MDEYEELMNWSLLWENERDLGISLVKYNFIPHICHMISPVNELEGL
jgi:hypothetical protein